MGCWISESDELGSDSGAASPWSDVDRGCPEHTGPETGCLPTLTRPAYPQQCVTRTVSLLTLPIQVHGMVSMVSPMEATHDNG